MIIAYKMIGDRIRKARQKLNISSEKLAELMDLSPSYIRRFENGSEEISLRRLAQICGILNEPIEYFIAGTAVTHAEAGNYEFSKIVESLSKEDIEMILDFDRAIAERIKKKLL